jgi:protein Tex
MQTSSPNPGAPPSDLSRIAQDLQIRKVQVEAVVQLLDEGNTVPFITRYRKERTGGLDEEKIRRVEDRVRELRQLADRKQTILKSIEGQGKLTDELRAAILAADTPKRLEDLYLPYKPKKRTLATEAREKGLEPLAQAIWNRDPAVANLPEVVQGMLNPEKGLNTPDDVRAGAGHILAEQLSEVADVRAAVRTVVWDTGKLRSGKAETVGPEKGLDYKDYFEFTESARHIPPHRVLAVNRGERENILRVKVEWDIPRAREAALAALPQLADHPHRDFLLQVLDDALARLLSPSLEREVRREQTEAAQGHAVAIFARNLRSLLLQPPLRGKRVLAIDPGLRTGCKLAALDDTGNLLEESVIYPHAPQNRKNAAKHKLEELVRKHQLGVLAIGNGTACRETEQLVSELIAELAEGGGKRPQPPATAPPPAEASASQPAAVRGVESPAPSGDQHLIPAAAPSEQPAGQAPPASPAAVSPTPSSPETPPTGEGPVAGPPPAPVGEATSPSPEAAATPPAPAPSPPPPPKQPKPEPPLPSLDHLPTAPGDIAYVIVNEAGASDYSASQVAREEFPGHDATTRGTISIGRRLQDPLAELVKIDPQHVGVGLYQHDVKPKHLKESLEAVIESCVNHVGVDLNTASAPLLRHISGLNQLVAREVVEHRQKSGPFRSREQLRDIPNVGPARYIQSAGFLKIPDGDDPLDATWIHPESYGVARQVLAELGFIPADLRDPSRLEQLRERLKEVKADEVAARMGAGLPTVKDILDALSRPGRDPRDDLPPPIFKKGILKLEDLQPGMELKGTVLNVVDFGAFVDIGLKDSGLVHISQMANRYIKNPYEVVSVGDVVTVWVLKVESERRRVSLTMIPPGTERTKPPERRPPPERAPQAPRERGERPGPRPPRVGGPPQRERGPVPQRGGPPQQRGPFRGRGPRPQPGQPAAASDGAPPPAPGAAPSQPQPAPPPPRKPPKPKPLPKLSQDALTGKKPLHTFGELEAFFKAKTTPPPPPAAEAGPVAETPTPVPPPAPPSPPAAPENTGG